MLKFVLFALGAMLVLASPAFAVEEVVTIGGGRAVLDKPAGARGGGSRPVKSGKKGGATLRPAPPLRLERRWCGREDSNLHGLPR